MRRKLTDAEWEQVAEQYREGRSVAKIAKYFGTSRIAVLHEMVQRRIKRPAIAPPEAYEFDRQLSNELATLLEFQANNNT